MVSRAVIAVIAALGCSKPEPTTDVKVPAASADAVAHFAGGCFWGVEHYLEQLDGVVSVESGFMGGAVDNPSYEDVINKDTGHLETVRVRYDSSKIGYEAITRRFFEIHDPTQTDGQGPDIGSQYLSAVFYGSESEKRIAEKLIGLLEKRGYEVATRVLPASEFWPADETHQNYYVKTGKQPYCHRRVERFGDEP